DFSKQVEKIIEEIKKKPEKYATKDFEDSFMKQLDVHSKFILYNDIAIQELIATTLQLKNFIEKVDRPAERFGCPFGSIRVNEKCYFIGPKATFDENKKYCDLLNASIVKVEQNQNNILSELLKPINGDNIWTSHSLMQPSSEPINPACAVFNPHTGLWSRGDCDEQHVQMTKDI
ncbi:hypothetical protein B4U80_14575, partial [Leptotrombidium deliense]